MVNRKYILVAAMIMLSILPVTASAVRVSEHCVNDTHIIMSFLFDLTAGGNTTAYNYTQVHMCAHNCSNDKCMGTYMEGDMQSAWLVYGIGIVLLFISIFLGIPYGKMVGKEDIKPGFDTRTMVRYMFFFVGIYLIYLSFGMVRRVGSVYGSEGGISTAVDTATMVMLITIVFFLFIFVAEFLFYTVKMFQKTSEETKWGEREL